MNKKGLFAINAFKLILKLTVTVLSLLLAITSEKRSKSPYTALEAHILHEDDLISDADYMKALEHDY